MQLSAWNPCLAVQILKRLFILKTRRFKRVANFKLSFVCPEQKRCWSIIRTVDFFGTTHIQQRQTSEER